MSKEELEDMRHRQLIRNATGEIGDINMFINDCTRQVRWLYNNANKCLKVIPEKDARILESKIQSLQKEVEEFKSKVDEFIKAYDSENSNRFYKAKEEIQKALKF